MDQNATEHAKPDKMIVLMQITLVLLRIVTTSSCGFIIYLIIKCRKLKTIFFLYVFNWNVVDFLFHLTANGMFFVDSVVEDKTTLWKARCLNLIFYKHFQITTAIFVIVLNVHWFFSIFSPVILTRYKIYHSSIVIIIWIFATFCVCTSIYDCFSDSHDFIIWNDEHIFFTIYCLLAAIILLTKGLARLKKIDSDQSIFALTVVYLINWLPARLLREFVVRDTISVLVVVSMWFGYLNSVFNLAVLAVVNKEFRESLLHLYRRAQGYEDASNDNWDANLNVRADVVTINRR